MTANLEPQRLPAKWATALAAATLVLAGLWAYRNIFSAPFFFDDLPGIVDNRSIRHLAEIGRVLSPPAADGSGVAGRPLVNLSLALNYAADGLKVRGYHAFNLAVHLLAGLTLFAIVRRTLERRGNAAAFAMGWTVALIWTVHPLLTESVTCVIQRTESMMGLFYLLTLYCFVRGSGGPPLSAPKAAGRRFYWLSIVCCLLGMATKEVMVTAPLVVLLYDRTFISGSFTAAWRARRSYYVGLAGTWLLLAYLVLSAGGKRGGAAGLGLGISPWTYALTQARAVAMYLKLAVWPHPLVVDYGHAVVTEVGAVAGQLALIGLLLAATVYGLFWSGRRALGFLGAWFFLVLAPSSSVLPLVTQTMAEHRMYLPLAAVVTLVVLGFSTVLGRRMIMVGIAGAIGLGALTARRNQDYRTGLAIWRDTVAKRPDNPRAQNDLALELAKLPGRSDEAIAKYREALRLQPDYAEAHNNLAITLDNAGKSAEAIEQYRQALAGRPNYPEALEGLAVALSRSGRTTEAEQAFQATFRIKPDYAEAHYNYAAGLAQIPGRVPEAVEQYRAALRIDPSYADAHFNLANLLATVPGAVPDAIAEYQAALRLEPNYAEGHNNLAIAYARLGRFELAKRQLEIALQLNPNFAGARDNLEKISAMK